MSRWKLCITLLFGGLLLGAAGVNSALADTPDLARDFQLHKSLEIVAAWKKNREEEIRNLVDRGASTEEAEAAVDERNGMAVNAIKLMSFPIRHSTPKLMKLRQKLSVIAAISNLGHERFQAFVKAHGFEPGTDFYNCLCPGQTWYAPSPDGPCEGRTAAYSTVYHVPFVNEPRRWADCASATHDATAGEFPSSPPQPSLFDQIIKKLYAARTPYEKDVCERLGGVLDVLRDLKAQGKLKLPKDSPLASGDWEQTFFDILVPGLAAKGFGEIFLSAASDKIGYNIGLVDEKSPTGLGFLLTHSDRPSKTGLRNPYVFYTKVINGDATIVQKGRLINMSYEMALARKIMMSNGGLAPQDVMRMALEVTKGDMPLAGLVAHNLLKEAAYAHRDQQPMVLSLIPKNLRSDDPEDHAIKTAYTELFERKGQFLDRSFVLPKDEIRSKLQDIRPVYDPHAEDRLGPWYHAFGLFFTGTNPALGEDFTNLGAATENALRLINLGSPRSLGKEAANRCAAELAGKMNEIIGGAGSAERAQ